MWHETKEEMVEFLKSIFRMDEDQCAHRILRNYLHYNLPNYYKFESEFNKAMPFVLFEIQDLLFPDIS